VSGEDLRAEVEVEVQNRMGLHTRPAKAFVQAANRFAARIEVCKGELAVNGKSIMGLMSLLAPQGTRLHIIAQGPDAAEAVQTLADVVRRRFGEGE
jgi:phosphotransferase system HPr (HPr) family protein